MNWRQMSAGFIGIGFATAALATEDGSQFSPLEAITPANVADIELVFEFHTGDLGEGFADKGHSFQATPVYHKGMLVVSTSSNEVIAFDAGNGQEQWRFDPNLDREVGYSESASRGISIWQGDSDVCPERIFHGTLHGRMYALSASTGKLCEDFGASQGTKGYVDLGIGIRNRRLGEYSVTSPVAVLNDRIIVGTSIGDNGAVDLEQGVVRALDPITGAVLWHWDPVPQSPDDPAWVTWENDSARQTGAANAWAPISVDPARRLVFVPTSSPSPDFYGGERLGENHYANSIVTLNADTGEVVWFQQLVHHDIWDYDNPAEPSLTTIRYEGKDIPAVVVVTKTGMMFAFDRMTGESIYPMVEKPVPQTDVPGERSHPTQPFSSIVLAPHEPVTGDDAFGLLGIGTADCREVIEQSRSEGIFTPPSLQGTIQYPGWTGGINWGGVALDEGRQLAIVNFMNMAGIIKLLPRQAFEDAVKNKTMPGWQLTPMRGTPYGMARRIFISDLGLPCVKPPWGHIVAIDLEKGVERWRKPLGTVQDLSPVPLPGAVARALFSDWGVPSHGGPLATASGVTFIGATLDYYFRAFASNSGEELWRYRLPTSANATPASYLHEGRQYVAIAVGGHSGAGTLRGDSVFVFALPE